MSSTEQNSPTLASLRAGRGKARSTRPSPAAAKLDLQADLLFVTAETEPVALQVELPEQPVTKPIVPPKPRSAASGPSAPSSAASASRSRPPTPTSGSRARSPTAAPPPLATSTSPSRTATPSSPSSSSVARPRFFVSAPPTASPFSSAAASPSTSPAASSNSSPRRWSLAAPARSSWPSSSSRPACSPKASSTPRANAPCPPSLARIGIITSPTGAVIRDIVTVVRRRHAPLNLLVYPAIMQGAIEPRLRRSRPSAGSIANPGHVDLILIARGGGSIEDLACLQRRSPRPHHRRLRSPRRLGHRTRD